MITRKKLLFITTFFLSINLFAQQNTIQFENSKQELEIFTLNNGLTIFILPDKNKGLVDTEFICKAGFSSQTPSTCGFFSMYSKLFTEGAPKEVKNIFDMFNFQSECKSQSTNFTACLPPEELSHYFNALSYCLIKPSLEDKVLIPILEKMKKDSLDYATSTAGFINSSIDSIVFFNEPWKHDSGIYPALFSDYSTSQARTILNNIRLNFYSPDNCALFISGNINSQQVLKEAEKAFSSWKNSRIFFNSNVDTKDFSLANDKKKYVLVSDDFSKDITQIIVQFTTLDITKNNILAIAMNNENSLYKTILPAEKKLCIRSSDYIVAASAQVNNYSRLILQSLIENSSSQNIIAEQANTFIQLAKESTKLSREDFIKAQNEILLDFKLKSGNSNSMQTLLSNYWPNALWTLPEDFYKGFQDSIYKVQFEDEKTIATLIDKEEPYIFLLVNSKNYLDQKKYFDKEGYIKIDKKNNSWWKNEILEKKAKAEKKELLKENKKEKSNIIKAKPAEFFYANSIKTIKEKKLNNGIPITIKTNKGSQTVCVSIAINGGLLSSPVKEKNLRTILVSSLAKNLSIYNANAITKESVSYLTYEVSKEEFRKSLKALTDTLIYNDIKPIQADRLFADENYKIFIENSNLGSQMKRNVFAYLYRETKLGQIYKDYDNENNSATYQSLLTSYTQLLDASLYSIVISGDIEAEDAFLATEETLGILKNQKKIDVNQEDFPKPAWKNKERKIQLRHLYSSDLPPELAPKESPLLIPTKEFLDPVQLYFAPPESLIDIERFNALLMEIAKRIDKDIESYCSFYEATKLIPIGYIHGNKIKRHEDFINLYKKHRNGLLEELADKKKRAKVLRTIKSRYEISLLQKTTTNEGTAMIIQQSIQNGKSSNYLSFYVEIENASAKDFYNILQKYIPEEPMMKVYSVDSIAK